MSKPGPLCPKCKSDAIRRLARHGFWQNSILPRLGRYPWECKICRTQFTLKLRGVKTRKRSSRNLEGGESASAAPSDAHA